MLPPLVQWLEDRRWIRSDSIKALEVPVNGRRVDLAILTKSGVLSSFELKLGGFGRVLEQAVYNTRSFDRSWIVIGNEPRYENLAEAERFGVGIIVVDGKGARLVLRPDHPEGELASRSRIVNRLRQFGGTNV